MTPRQFHLLWARHREGLLHREMVQALTTAAIINYSLCRPETPVEPKAFMPNYSEPIAPKVTQTVDVSDEALADYRSRRAHITALLQQYQTTGKADPYLIEIGLIAHE